MKPTIRTHIRELLQRSDGMSARELSEVVGKNYETVRKALVAMPDAYIDRWAKTGNVHGRAFEAVWMVVEVPPNCPHPNKELEC